VRIYPRSSWFPQCHTLRHCSLCLQRWHDPVWSLLLDRPSGPNAHDNQYGNGSHNHNRRASWLRARRLCKLVHALTALYSILISDSTWNSKGNYSCVQLENPTSMFKSSLFAIIGQWTCLIHTMWPGCNCRANEKGKVWGSLFLPMQWVYCCFCNIVQI
jgi:hypothetical protein